MNRLTLAFLQFPVLKSPLTWTGLKTANGDCVSTKSMLQVPPLSTEKQLADRHLVDARSIKRTCRHLTKRRDCFDSMSVGQTAFGKKARSHVWAGLSAFLLLVKTCGWLAVLMDLATIFGVHRQKIEKVTDYEPGRKIKITIFYRV